MSTLLLDGRYTTGFFVGRPAFSFPFTANGDVTSFLIEREWRQSAASYVPGRQGVDKDPVFNNAYLVGETAPATLLIGDIISTRRTYARIPADQVNYSSRSLTKPTIPNEGSVEFSLNNYPTAVEVATAVLNNTGIWATTDAVFAPFVTLNANLTTGVASGGTFAVTYKASTTGAIAYNESNANIATAINALADIISDGITVSCSNALASTGILNVTATAGNFASNTMTMDLTNTTVNTSKVSWTYASSVTTRALSITGELIVGDTSDMSAAAALLLVNTSNTGWVVPAANWAVKNVSTLQVPALIGIGGGYGTIAYAASQLRTYTPGTTVLSARITEKFYLPGVTAGISIVTDIPITVPNISDADIIAAVLASGGSNFAAVDFQGPERWRDGPIYRTVKTEIDFGNL
jgi:hypothetical protein